MGPYPVMEEKEKTASDNLTDFSALTHTQSHSDHDISTNPMTPTPTLVIDELPNFTDSRIVRYLYRFENTATYRTMLKHLKMICSQLDDKKHIWLFAGVHGNPCGNNWSTDTIPMRIQTTD